MVRPTGLLVSSMRLAPSGFVASRLHENSFLTNFSNLGAFRARLQSNTGVHETKKGHLKVTFVSLARPTGFEPVAPRLGKRSSSKCFVVSH